MEIRVFAPDESDYWDRIVVIVGAHYGLNPSDLDPTFRLRDPIMVLGLRLATVFDNLGHIRIGMSLEELLKQVMGQDEFSDLSS